MPTHNPNQWLMNMGYCISVQESKFTIKKDNFQKALEAIQALHGKERIEDSGDTHFFWVDYDFYKIDNLNDMLKEWRWAPTFTNGDITDIDFTGEKYGDDDVLFKTIAPFVEAGSFIHFIGEDGNQWKFTFNGKEMKEVSSDTVFQDDETLSTIEKERFLKVFTEFLKDNPEITVKNLKGIAKALPHEYIIGLMKDFLHAQGE